VWYINNMMRFKDGWFTVKFPSMGVKVACVSSKLFGKGRESSGVLGLGCSVTTVSLSPDIGVPC